MASQPRLPPPQRRQSPLRDAQSEHQPEHRSPVRPRSSASEDSQTVFLNKPSEDTQPDQQQDGAPRQGLRRTETSESSVKKCWICIAESNEDTPETSPWRDPCPCALQAHEDCLLDWIADIEAPNQRRNKQVAPQKIYCPQCKSEIKLARPRDVLVEAYRALERLGQKLVMPGSLMVLSSIIQSSCTLHGIHSIYAIFGIRDGYRILHPMVNVAARPKIELDISKGTAIGNVLLDRVRHWRLYVGLPLITPILIASRSSIADSVLPVLPVLFFATQTQVVGEPYDFGKWPPSASLAFSLLPYARSAYNLYYEHFWLEKERKWLKAVQPRTGQESQPEDDNAEGDQQNQVEQVQAEDDNIFEVRIDGGIWDEWDDEEANPNRPVEEQPQVQPQNFGDAGNPAPQIADDQPQQGRRAQQNQQQQNNQRRDQDAQRERRLSFSPVALAESVLGALVFPKICEASGELMRLVLPKSWTRAPASGPTGLLQQKWGRSLVGGCLFVVFKDAVILYVRWRMAQMHRKRRVLDYDRSQKR